MNKMFMLGFLSLSVLSFSSPSYATSDAECAIWLCLPAGFPAGCSDAKNAFHKRIRKGKSPLPAFASCAVSEANNSAFEGGQPKVVEGSGSYIPAHKACIRQSSQQQCQWQTVPERHSLQSCYTLGNLRGAEQRTRCFARRTITLMQGNDILGDPFYY